MGTGVSIETTVLPVSYTHLDVYKRQVRYLSLFCKNHAHAIINYTYLGILKHFAALTYFGTFDSRILHAALTFTGVDQQ